MYSDYPRMGGTMSRLDGFSGDEAVVYCMKEDTRTRLALKEGNQARRLSPTPQTFNAASVYAAWRHSRIYCTIVSDVKQANQTD